MTKEREEINDKQAAPDEPLLPIEQEEIDYTDELKEEDARLNKRLRIRIIAAIITVIVGIVVFYFTVVRNQAIPSSPPPGVTSGEIK